MKYGYELLEDRYYSDYDYENALYEKAFNEGYEYAQREFSNKAGRAIKGTNRLINEAREVLHKEGVPYSVINKLKNGIEGNHGLTPDQIAQIDKAVKTRMAPKVKPFKAKFNNVNSYNSRDQIKLLEEKNRRSWFKDSMLYMME